VGPAGHAPLQAELALGTGQAIGAHTGAGVGADGPACIQRREREASLGATKSGCEAAYTMPDWTGRTAKSSFNIKRLVYKSYDASACFADRRTDTTQSALP